MYIKYARNWKTTSYNLKILILFKKLFVMQMKSLLRFNYKMNYLIVWVFGHKTMKLTRCTLCNKQQKNKFQCLIHQFFFLVEGKWVFFFIMCMGKTGMYKLHLFVCSTIFRFPIFVLCPRTTGFYFKFFFFWRKKSCSTSTCDNKILRDKYCYVILLFFLVSSFDISPYKISEKKILKWVFWQENVDFVVLDY